MDEYYIPGFTDYLSSSVSPTALSAGAPAPQTLSGMLSQLDQLERGRYAKPIAGETASGLTTMDGLPGLQFITNKGKAASVKANRSGFVPYVEGAEYRLTNERKKQYGIAASGVGEEGLQSVYNTARNLSATQGKKADWVVEMKDPASGQWAKVADDDPKTNPIKVAGKVIGTALPIAVSLIPGLQFAGPVLSSALAGGAGAALAGRDPLKGAVMGGLSAAGGQVIGGALQSGGALGTNLAANAAHAVGTGVGSFAGGLATGQNLQNAALGGLAAGGLSYLGGEIFKPGSPGATPETPGDLAASFDKAFAVAPNAGTASIAPTVGSGGEIVVTAPRFSPNFGTVPININNLGGVRDYSAQQEPARQEDNVVNGVDQTTGEIVAVAPTTTPTFSLDLSNLGFDPATQKTVEDYAKKNLTEEQKKGLTTADYIRLASLALGLGGDLFGGGGGGAKVPGGLGGGGNLGSVFNKPLPAPNMPGLTAGTGGPRAPTDLAAGGLRSPQDYYRYGYGPEQSFFKNVPQGAPNTSTAFTGYAEGGYAVGGEGDGRDDKIPALLSDGEYVIDAETVAMLGNGSNKAGAKRLDDLRVNIRKHKGRKLASGKFSDNAKKPEQYLAKGRKHG